MVCHFGKYKSGNVFGLQKHNQRENENYSNIDIDKARTPLNYDLVNQGNINYLKRVKSIIEANRASERAIRKDATVYCECIISSDSDFFENLTEDKQKEFFKSSLDYLKSKIGEEFIVSANVHLDETTPHMHVGFVPIIENSLSAKKLIDRKFLMEVQDQLPAYLKNLGFDIQRGIKGSKRKNKDTKELKKELDREDENKYKDINAIESKKTFLGQNRAISEGDYEKILLNFTKMALEKQKLEKEILFLKNNSEIKDSNIKHLENSIEYYRKRKIEDEKEFKNTLNELKDKINELNKTIDSNYKDIKKKVREDHAKGIEKLLDNLNEMREENEELKKLNERYKNIADNRIDTIIDLYKEQEWTDEFLELIGKEKMLKSFIENKREKEEEFYNNSHSYNNFNKSKENEHEMSL